ncbi:MAG: sulfurtransferase [Gammaproteobacteria bacterium]|nr:sulfurtransferase [Gammaproteobacteria bacterium]
MFARFIMGISLYLLLGPLFAATPLVSADWLGANLHRPGLVVLDLQPNATYRRYHVPGAVHSDYDDWRTANAVGTAKMLPPVARLEQLIGGLGIDNESQVVLVITGRSASEMASAARVYWSFKALGHDRVSILDGGLLAYANQRGNRMEGGVVTPRQKRFKAQPRAEYLVDAETVKAALNDGTPLIDNRSDAEHLGLLSGGGKERAGTIPGARSLPFNWLTVNGGVQFHSERNLRRIYRAAGVPLSGAQISFCHTGHRTALAWFVSHELLGNSEARLYDGSTAEWAANPTLPIERKIELE